MLKPLWSRKLWLRFVFVTIVIVTLQLLLHLFFLLGGPYERAIASYASHMPDGAKATFRLCYTCQKRISYSQGSLWYRFSVDVTSPAQNVRLEATVRKSTKSGAYDVELGPSRLNSD